MLKIEREHNGRDSFIITVSEPGTGTRGYKTGAKNIAEVTKAAEHYFGIKTKRPHGGKMRSCPLCRMMVYGMAQRSGL
jgi:hypothetical protein